MAFAADAGGDRQKVFRSLAARNRLVGILRIGVPALGALIFVILSVQIYVGSLLAQYGISGITIDRNNLVIETPTYSGTGGDGTHYSMAAATARTPIDNHDQIALEQMKLTLDRLDGRSMVATSESAQIISSTQTLIVPGVATVTGDAGVAGTLSELTVDLMHHTMVAKGPVDLELSGGATIVASSLDYDGQTRIWRFTRATVTLPMTPGEEAGATGDTQTGAPQ